MSSALSLDHWQGVIGRWAAHTFPLHTVDSHIVHLREEVEELAHGGLERLPEEVADCLILLLSLAHHRRFSLADALADKHRVNIDRHWGEPDALGVVHHSAHQKVTK